MTVPTATSFANPSPVYGDGSGWRGRPIVSTLIGGVAHFSRVSSRPSGPSHDPGREALTQCYPGQPSGTVARHLITLAALISGIVGSKSTQLPHIATKVPDGTKPESRVKRFARWCDNAHILEEVYFLPYADVLLRHLALQTVVLVMDGSGVGRGCTALMIHVVYKGRALPLAWRVRQAPKGHFPEELHIALVELISGLIPAGVQVVLLGDGEFDGTGLQQTLQQAGWS